ncbi:HAD-IB family hydrolase [bacterium]|nr:HAD-IB family hydrolase [bacterium]MDA9901079.1 HAD-IB family hydrolase [Gammaproteobacteria bacterium]MDB2443701.1 HAD-IB family hydrolase [Gammaproteobacteria bacterium]
MIKKNASRSKSRLVLFDLDNTLLNGDSDHEWGEFLIRKGLVDEKKHRMQNDIFYEQYQNSILDINEYVLFTLKPVLNLNHSQLNFMHTEFMSSSIKPLILSQARSLVNDHLKANDFCIIITATNEYIAAPIAEEFKVNHFFGTSLVTYPREKEFFYTGEISGTPCYQHGKVEKIKQWLKFRDDLNLSDSIFYSDSINDLPLLEQVSTPIVIDGDQKLIKIADERGWEQKSLRN